MPEGHQARTLHETTHTSRTKTVSGCFDDYAQTIAAEQDPGDAHVQSHLHELTERDDHVTVH